MQTLKSFFWPVLVLAFSLNLAACSDDNPVSDERQKTPDFILTDTAGEEFQLSDYAGKVVVLNFFSTTCQACREEAPELQATYEKYKDSGVVIAGIAMGKAEDLKAYADELKLTFPVLADTDGRVTLTGYGISRVPSFYIVDREGWIYDAFAGSPLRTDWDTILKPLL